jgi:hypothetical protein
MTRPPSITGLGYHIMEHPAESAEIVELSYTEGVMDEK